MSPARKQLSSPASTGGLGIHFENRVQASFTILMLTEGYAPCLNTWPIHKIKLQGRYQGYDTDDLIVYTKQPGTGREAKLLGQIKHKVSITKSNGEFGEVIQAAWNDYNNKDIFAINSDTIALICGPLSATDTDAVRTLLRQAEHSENATDFLNRVELSRLSSEQQRKKLEVFKHHLKVANNDESLTDEQLFQFLKSYRLLIYDLDMKGVILSLVHSLIGQYSPENANSLWTQVLDKVEWESENAGIITIESIPEDIRSAFERKPTEEIIPDSYVVPAEQKVQQEHIPALTAATVIGNWDEKNDNDKEIIRRIADGF